MMKAFQPIGPLVAAVVRERSLTLRQEEFHVAEALADSAHEAVADFACQARFSRVADVRAFAVLNERAYAAERRRGEAKRRLLLEFCEAVNAVSREDKAS